MTDAGYVYAGYLVTFAAIGTYAAWVIAKGKRIAKINRAKSES